jgi:hypothetical protein
MLETGRYATIKEIAKGERINPSYVSRVLQLTLLAPATVEARSLGGVRTQRRRSQTRWCRSRSSGRSKRAAVTAEHRRFRVRVGEGPVKAALAEQRMPEAVHQSSQHAGT